MSEAAVLRAPVPSRSPAPARPSINLLSYVHLRNIHACTGAGRVARQLTEHLALREDVNLRILADPADHAKIVPLTGAPWDRFAYCFFASETSRQQAKWFAFDRPRAESYWPEAQVVFCTAESYVPVKRARLAVTVHDAAYFEEEAHCRNESFRKQRFKWRLLYSKLARKVDLFHTVSHFSAERLGHFFPAIRPRLRVVPNAVSPHFFAPVGDAGLAFLRRTGLAARPFILVPGGLHFRKNAGLILEAWPLLRSLHPDLLLAIVNHSNPEFALQAARIGDSIRQLGFVPDDGLRALYAAASAVWFPSRYEGFGLPVVEAMACGAPVLVSRASSLPEVAADAALYASPAAPREHVDALDALLENEALRADLSERGLRRAAQFTWQSSSAQLKSYFEELL